MIDRYQSIGLFIDGGYYAKINEALEESMSLNINVSSLMSFIKGRNSKDWRLQSFGMSYHGKPLFPWPL